MQYLDRANAGVKALSPYQAGKPIEELERELGIKNIIKLRLKRKIRSAYRPAPKTLFKRN